MQANTEQNNIRIDFVSKDADGECRCKNCKKLLAKIKNVDKRMVIEIKCTRSHCGLVNTFNVSRNANYLEESSHFNECGFTFKTK